MANMYGITGKLSGKMGSAVFRVRDGQQVVAQYNPVVKNPNTDAQQSARAKFKLISQLAAIMSPGFGSMNTSKSPAKGQPSQRNAFASINYELISTSEGDSGVVASIPMEKLQLTSSKLRFGAIEVTSPEAGSISVDINNVPKGVKTGRVVLVGYGTMGVTKQAFVQEIFDVPINDGRAELLVENLNPGDYTVLSFGLIPSESAIAKIAIDNIHTPDSEAFISAVALDAMVRDGEIAETVTVGANYILTT